MSLHQVLLEPTDLLFFRDGRPMAGSLAGHTAAWPLPDVTNHALHAALHRAELDRQPDQGLHVHRRGRSGWYSTEDDHRDRKFGSLVTAGPFPVRRARTAAAHPDLTWFFPRPKDAQVRATVAVTLRPAAGTWATTSSLRAPLTNAVVSALPPQKEASAEPWLSTDAYAAYLQDAVPGACDVTPPASEAFLDDAKLAETEHYVGIGLDQATGTVAESQFYRAHYLRLHEGFRLGLFAEAMDIEYRHERSGGDLIAALLPAQPRSILVGGQQRICTAHREDVPASGLPLPHGMGDGFACRTIAGRARWLLKWMLLTPAIWPEMLAGPSRRGTLRKPHPGGWLPNWVCPETGGVLLEKISADERARRRKLNCTGTGYVSQPNISARLVAAIVPKPLVVTGWSLGGIGPGSEPGDPGFSCRPAGAKSTHLAVAAGGVYYFQADSPEAARDLASALNWHGGANSEVRTPNSEIRNRRSTLLGEKGYGLGVCGTWRSHAEEGDAP